LRKARRLARIDRAFHQGTDMNRSFAHSPGRRQWPLPRFARPRHAAPFALLALLALSACVTLPPPTAELAAARQAIANAGDADAAQYAPEDFASAQAELQQAQSAMAAGDEAAARASALVAAAGGDLARERSRVAVLDNDYAQRRDEIARLRAQLQVDDAPAAPVPQAPEDGQAMGPELRLQALDTDPRFTGAGAYERLRAEQAVQALATAKSRDRQAALVLAARRVAIAELAAHGELVRREVARLDQVRSDLLLEASRRDAERARQEAERLRLQSQIQAEEAERLRATAAAEAAARQQAEDVILDVGGEQAEKLKAARDREAELARQEAELLQAQQAAGGAPAPAKAAPKAPSKPPKKKK
jgi:hypothetical protein